MVGKTVPVFHARMLNRAGILPGILNSEGAHAICASSTSNCLKRCAMAVKAISALSLAK